MRVSLLKKYKEAPLHNHWLVFAVLGAFALAFFVHPDVIETANHSYVMLDGLFKGRFLQFYNDVMAQPFGTNLYYINYAHYNIFIYIIFGIVELPVYLFNLIFGTAINEPLLYFIGKLVSAGFFAACLPLVHKIALELGLKPQTANLAALAFALSPPAFFSTFVMGQYDSICLFFLLLGLLYWLRGNLLGCAFMLGAGGAAKFFSLLVLVPLVLLREKRPLHILKYGLVSLWLLLPTGLLFAGRTGDMGLFNNIMLERLFAASLPAGRAFPLYPTLYLILCVAAYLWRPSRERLGCIGLWMCLAVLGGIFLFTYWNAQWVVLLAPFVVLTTLLEKERRGWFWLSILSAAGYFLLCFTSFAGQLEANLLDSGVLGLLTGLSTALVAHNNVAFYLNLLPAVSALGMVLFGGALLCHILFKLPLKAGTPASRLANAGDKATVVEASPKYIWLSFAAGMAIWLLPTLFTWCKAFGFL